MQCLAEQVTECKALIYSTQQVKEANWSLVSREAEPVCSGSGQTGAWLDADVMARSVFLSLSLFII